MSKKWIVTVPSMTYLKYEVEAETAIEAITNCKNDEKCDYIEADDGDIEYSKATAEEAEEEEAPEGGGKRSPEPSSVLIVSYKLPKHYLAYFVSGDASGLDDHEHLIAENWIAAKLEYHGGLFYCVGQPDDAGECMRNDLTDEFSDCMIFNFQVNKEA